MTPEEIMRHAWRLIINAVKKLYDEEGKTFEKIGEMCGVSKPTVLRWYNETEGGVSTPFTNVLRCLRGLNIPYEDVFASELKGIIRRADPLAPAETVTGEDLPTVPVYDFAGAGPEFCIDSLEAITRLPVLQQYYRDGMYAVQIFGDSMEPTIHNRAYVGVMPYDGELVEGAMYLIWRPYFGKLVKRVYMGDDALILRSDNPKFEDIHLQYEGHDRVIIARVMWIWQEC
jgi:hypothetical protein